jgi:hypothetical protein
MPKGSSTIRGVGLAGVNTGHIYVVAQVAFPLSAPHPVVCLPNGSKILSDAISPSLHAPPAASSRMTARFGHTWHRGLVVSGVDAHDLVVVLDCGLGPSYRSIGKWVKLRQVMQGWGRKEGTSCARDGT